MSTALYLLCENGCCMRYVSSDESYMRWWYVCLIVLCQTLLIGHIWMAWVVSTKMFMKQLKKTKQIFQNSSKIKNHIDKFERKFIRLNCQRVPFWRSKAKRVALKLKHITHRINVSLLNVKSLNQKANVLIYL